jgi:hypothetical protein
MEGEGATVGNRQFLNTWRAAIYTTSAEGRFTIPFIPGEAASPRVARSHIYVIHEDGFIFEDVPPGAVRM